MTVPSGDEEVDQDSIASEAEDETKMPGEPGEGDSDNQEDLTANSDSKKSSSKAGGEEGTGEEGEDAESESSSGGKKKLFIIIGAVLLLLIGGGAAVFFTGLLDPLLGSSEESAEEDGAEGEEREEGEDGKKGGPKKAKKAVFFDLDEMLVTLNSADRRPRLLKIKVSLEVSNQKDVATIEQLMPRVIDNFQAYVRELRAEDLRGSAGMYMLREELFTRINVAVKPAKVSAVLFKEMLIQ